MVYYRLKPEYAPCTYIFKRTGRVRTVVANEFLTAREARELHIPDDWTEKVWANKYNLYTADGHRLLKPGASVALLKETAEGAIYARRQ